jgi:hypothetical protein
MSVESMMKRSFEKHSERRITIIQQTTKSGALNAVKTIGYEPLKSVPCFFNSVVSESDNSEGGERQSYEAKALVIYDEVIDIEEFINPSCRILIGDYESIDEQALSKSWIINLIRPVSRIEGFWIIQFDICKPKSGNKVHLS